MSSTAASSTGPDTLRDSNIPTFNGTLSEYREYRRRIKLYMGKMKILKREAEGFSTCWERLEALHGS